MNPAAAETIAELRRDFFRRHPGAAAGVAERLPLADVTRLVGDDTGPGAANVVEGLTLATAAQALERMDVKAAAALAAAMDPARAASILAGMEEVERDALLGALDSASAAELRELLRYPPDAAGGLMDPRVLSFRTETTVDEALAKIRTTGRRVVNHVYLVDERGHLIGTVSLRDLAVAEGDVCLGRLSRGVPVSVRATSGREEVVQELTERRLPSIPVVDFDDRLLGVIRYDALVRAVQDEVSADIQTMVGASADERALSPVLFSVRKRLPWLQINLLTAFLAAAVVGIFESTIARYTALAVLLPVVAGQSGNTGAQALAVTMRGLVMREIRVLQWWQVSFKEVRVAALNGVGVALTTSLAVYVWSRSIGLALIIGISMVISMIAAGLAGAATPLVLTALRQDPAQSSSIILTTVTDVVGFFSFLGIATLLSGLM